MSENSTEFGAFELAFSAILGVNSYTTDPPRVVLEAFFFGLYTLVGAVGLSALLRTGAPSKPAKLALLACTAMYALAIAHLAVDLRHLTTDVGNSRILQGVALVCLETVENGDPNAFCSAIDEQEFSELVQPAGTGREWAQVVLLVVNIILSNAILLWRSWTLSSRKRVVVGVVSVVLFLATVALLIIGTFINENLEDDFGTAALFLTWTIILWAAVLMVYSMWHRRSEIGRSMRDYSLGIRAEKYLLLFFQSGIPYVVFWTVIMAWCAVLWSVSAAPSAVRFVHAIRALNASCLIDIVGLYTTAILALTALSSTSARRLSTASDDHPLARVRMSASVGPAGVHRLEYDKDGGMDEEDMKYGAGLVL